MARTNPLGKIKDLTLESLRSPRTAAGRAVDQARGAATTGLAVTGQLTRTAASTALKVSGTIQSHVRKPPVPTRTAAPEPAPAAKTAPEPVNVVEELGLDPAPVEEPAAAHEVPATAAPGPETGIDAKADASTVDATPADVAAKVARRAPARKASPTAPARKKAPAKKSAPGAKLPPRRRTDETENA